MSRQNFLAMVYKLGQRAAKRWRRLRGFEHLAEVIAGVKFKDGVRVETEERCLIQPMLIHRTSRLSLEEPT